MNAKMEKVFEQLERCGAIVKVGSRKCNCSGKESPVWATLEGVEQMALKKVGFKEDKPNLFTYNYRGIVCYQDFRKGKRRSYCFGRSGLDTYIVSDLRPYKRFKEELKLLLGKSEEQEEKMSKEDLK